MSWQYIDGIFEREGMSRNEVAFNVERLVTVPADQAMYVMMGTITI